MESTPLVSVIVPVYNMSQWLERCMRSLLRQSYRNLEIILVDDGSTDDSPDICRRYAEEDSRVIVLHKSNGGQGSARNAALDIARGEYIGFVDPDDWIAPDMYAFMVGKMYERQADIVQVGWHTVSGEESGTDVSEVPLEKTYSNREALSELAKGQAAFLNTSVCSKLFRSTAIRGLRFSEVRAYEDDEFVYKAVWRARKIVADSTAKYYYFIRPGSTMTSRFNLNKLALVTVQKNICDFLKTNVPELYDRQQRVLCSKQFYVLACLQSNKALDPGGMLARQTVDAILDSYEEYMRNPQMGMNRLMLWALKHTPVFFWSFVLRRKFSRSL